MGVTREKVEWVARLARLKLAEKEVLTFAGQLGEILDYVEKLKEVPVEGVEPTSHPAGTLIPLRNDRIENPLPAARALSNAPKKKERHFKVPPAVAKSQGQDESNPKSE